MSRDLYGGKIEQRSGMTMEEWNEGKVVNAGPVIIPIEHLQEGPLKMHLAKPEAEFIDTPRTIEYRETKARRERIDVAQAERLKGAIDSKLMKALTTAVTELEEHERLLAETRAERAALDTETPMSKAQVEALSERYVRLEAMITQYTRLAEGAHRVYVQVATQALAEARTKAKAFLRQADDQYQRDMEEIHRMQDEVKARRAVFNDQHDSVCRMQSLVANADIDVFRDVLR